MSEKSISEKEIRVLETTHSLFDKNDEYVIPLYQRSFAWGEKQLEQLVDDICDIDVVTNGAKNYYMGSLIVSKQEGKYEVIDGQQRLTSLYLLLHCLGLSPKPTLTFACRDKSNYTLLNIKNIIGNNDTKQNALSIDWDKVEQGIKIGLDVLMSKVNKMLTDLKIDKEMLRKKLEKVIIYRIEVPEHTDLNRYFEIMNTRGVQLEQHDILKAKLLDPLNDDKKEQRLFAKIWEACSDMTGYVQMHFENRKKTKEKNDPKVYKSMRQILFGDDWNHLPEKTFTEFVKEIDENCCEESHSDSDDSSIIRIINSEPDEYNSNEIEYDEGKIRFRSIIDFPVFLLHVLKVFIELKKITPKEDFIKLVDEMLDDKKLLSAFNRVIDNGVIGGKPVSEHQKDFSREFIMCLLKSRFLFDKFILKREFRDVKDEQNGKWSIRMLEAKDNKGGYVNTKLIDQKDNESIKQSDNESLVKQNVMIQSALRVSYTSPRVMHWITKLLKWLAEDDCIHVKNGDLNRYNKQAEEIAKENIKKNFINVCEGDKYMLGVNTPLIVFNYLDYLLWNNEKSAYKDFNFEFRNSVEHWYPRNPTECERWEDGVDTFGNLCLLPRDVNSRFSNLPPHAKKEAFDKRITNASIKLQLMSRMTINGDGGNNNASEYWRKYNCKIHEDTMISILKKGCGIEDTNQ